jgi:hypothetical protein
MKRKDILDSSLRLYIVLGMNSQSDFTSPAPTYGFLDLIFLLLDE